MRQGSTWVLRDGVGACMQGAGGGRVLGGGRTLPACCRSKRRRTSTQHEAAAPAALYSCGGVDTMHMRHLGAPGKLVRRSTRVLAGIRHQAASSSGSKLAAAAAAAAVPVCQPTSPALAWNDETRHTVQLLLCADLHWLNTGNAAQQSHVLAKAALQRQHANADGLHGATCPTVQSTFVPAEELGGQQARGCGATGWAVHMRAVQKRSCGCQWAIWVDEMHC